MSHFVSVFADPLHVMIGLVTSLAISILTGGIAGTMLSRKIDRHAADERKWNSEERENFRADVREQVAKINGTYLKIAGVYSPIAEEVRELRKILQGQDHRLRVVEDKLLIGREGL